MPPLPAVPQVVKFTVQGTLAGDPWANVLHWLYDGGPMVDADCDHYAGVLWNHFPLVDTGANFLFDPETLITGVLAEDLGGTAVGGHIASSNGTSTAAHLPSVQNCALIHHQIARRYKGGHPRTYLAGVSGDHLLSATTWNSGTVSTLTGAWTSLQAAMDAASSGATNLVGQVSVSYFDSALVPTPPHLRTTPVVDVILGSTCEARVATQRRRVGR